MSFTVCLLQEIKLKEVTPNIAIIEAIFINLLFIYTPTFLLFNYIKYLKNYKIKKETF